MSDLISRSELINAMNTWDKFGCNEHGRLVRLDSTNNEEYVPYVHYEDMVNCVKNMPTAYSVDKVVEELEELKARYFLTIANTGDEKSDFAYENVGNALDKAIEIVIQAAEKYNNGWIPCSEKLPEDRDWHLAVFEEVDTGFIGLPYIADYLMGAHTKYTTNDGWILHNCTDGEDGSGEYYKNLRCVAWQRLPEPYKAE